MIWWLIPLVWLIGFGISMRKWLTQSVENLYRDRLACEKCNMCLNSTMNQDVCAKHEKSEEIGASVFASVIWPIVVVIMVSYVVFTKVFFFPTGRLKSASRDRWEQQLESIKTKREFDDAEKKYRALTITAEIEAPKRTRPLTASEIEAQIEVQKWERKRLQREMGRWRSSGLTDV